MQVSHKVSFAGSQQFEQHSATFTLESADISPALLDGCNLIEQMFVFNTLVVFEGLLFQYTLGYLSKEDFKNMKSRVFGLLNPKLRKIVDLLLKEVSDGDIGNKVG